MNDTLFLKKSVGFLLCQKEALFSTSIFRLLSDKGGGKRKIEPGEGLKTAVSVESDEGWLNGERSVARDGS
jgi:hypothetical protein